jgi:hypothetical protein
VICWELLLQKDIAYTLVFYYDIVQKKIDGKLWNK